MAKAWSRQRRKREIAQAKEEQRKVLAMAREEEWRRREEAAKEAAEREAQMEADVYTIARGLADFINGKAKITATNPGPGRPEITYRFVRTEPQQ